MWRIGKNMIPSAYGVVGENEVTVIAIVEAGNRSIEGRTTIVLPRCPERLTRCHSARRRCIANSSSGERIRRWRPMNAKYATNTLNHIATPTMPARYVASPAS